MSILWVYIIDESNGAVHRSLYTPSPIFLIRLCMKKYLYMTYIKKMTIINIVVSLFFIPLLFYLLLITITT